MNKIKSAIDQDFGGVRITNFKIDQDLIPSVSRQVTIGEDKLRFWSESGNKVVSPLDTGNFTNKKDLSGGLEKIPYYTNINLRSNTVGTAGANIFAFSPNTVSSVVKGDAFKISADMVNFGIHFAVGDYIVAKTATSNFLLITQNISNWDIIRAEDGILDTIGTLPTNGELEVEILPTKSALNEYLDYRLNDNIAFRNIGLDLSQDVVKQLTQEGIKKPLKTFDGFSIAVAGTVAGIVFEKNDILYLGADIDNITQLPSLIATPGYIQQTKWNRKNATTTQYGLTKLATDTEVTNRTGGGVVTAAQLALLIASLGNVAKVQRFNLTSMVAGQNYDRPHTLGTIYLTVSGILTSNGEPIQIGWKVLSNSLIRFYSDVDINEDVVLNVIG